MDPKYELVEVETSAGIETTASDSEQSRLGTDKQEATAASSPSSSLTTLATQPPTPPLPPQPPDLQHERPPHEAPVSSPPAPSSSPSSTARNGLTHNNNNNNNVASSDGGGGGGEIDSGRETRAEEEEGEGGGGEVEESVREEKLASETAKLINKDSLNTDINHFAHKDASNGGGDDGWDPESKLVGDQEVEIVIEQQHNDLIYKVSDCPPWYLTLFYAFQQSLTPVSGNLSIAILIADFVCGEDDEVLKTKLICTAMFMSGLSTFLQNTIGVRIPLYQGPSSAYIVPLIAMGSMKEWSCDIDMDSLNMTTNVSRAILLEEKKNDLLQQMTGSLVVAGALHMLTSGLGMLGLLLRIIGPVTVVPAITLVGLFVYKPASRFSETNWGIAIFVLALGLTLSLYLSKWSLPILAWSRKKGFHIKRTMLHKTLAILICILVGWLVCGILTATNVFPNDPTAKSYKARTDSRIHVLKNFSWFYFPYPLQFGYPKFSIGMFVNFLVATIISIIDSIGDYYACAQIARVPSPPVHAVNRGLFIEGTCSFFNALLGAGHATTTYGGNIGIIGMTKVASRRVFQVLGLIYIFFGIMGKVGALFITIPYPVLGGVQLLSFGIFIGVVLANLQYIDLNSTRNLAIIGMGLLLGLMVPYYGEKNPDAFDTGIEELTSALRMMLRNPTFVGGALACFLDNTIPGTLEERGITTWMPDLADDSKKKSKQFLKEQDKVYGFSFLPKKITDSWLFAVIPFLPSGRQLRLVEEDEEEGMELEKDEDNEKNLTKA